MKLDSVHRGMAHVKENRFQRGQTRGTKGERHELHGNKSRGFGGRKFVVYIRFIVEFYTKECRVIFVFQKDCSSFLGEKELTCSARSLYFSSWHLYFSGKHNVLIQSNYQQDPMFLIHFSNHNRNLTGQLSMSSGLFFACFFPMGEG